MRQEDFINCPFGCGVYIITNIINGHVYVGQTRRRFVERWREHIKSSRSPSNEDYWFPLHAAMRKYGIENFDFAILEQCLPDELDNRERYWIKYYNATSHDNYNCSSGGQLHRSEDDEKWLAIINDILNTNDPLSVIARRHNVMDSVVSAINCGTRHTFPQFTYPLRKKYGIVGINDVIQLLLETNKSFEEIAKQTNTSVSKVKRINKGEGNYHIKGYNYPLRAAPGMSDEVWNSLVADLQTTNLDFYTLGQKYGFSYDTIRKTNNGERNYHEGTEYPIRK